MVSVIGARPPARPTAKTRNVVVLVFFCALILSGRAPLHIHSRSIDPLCSALVWPSSLSRRRCSRLTCYARGGQQCVTKPPPDIDILPPSQLQAGGLPQFHMQSVFAPAGDQQATIDALCTRLPQEHALILHGATGTGKTFVVANVIANLTKPTLVVCYNLNLCEQFFNTMKRYFPADCFVRTFFSKYSAYRQRVDENGKRVVTYSKINEECDNERKAVGRAVARGKPVIVVASCCCVERIARNDIDEMGFHCHDAECSASLLDLFHKTYGDDFLVVVDESHVTMGQIFSKKFKRPPPVNLSSCVLYVSATPGKWEEEHTPGRVSMVQRPTHILDPIITLSYTKDGMPHDHEINDMVLKAKNDGLQVLIFCTRKSHAAGISHSLNNEQNGLSSRHITCDDTKQQRNIILQKFRSGKIDALVCVSTVREGMDFPGVGLVLVMNADSTSDSLCRNQQSLEQICGRGARNPKCRVIFFAKHNSSAMLGCIAAAEERRRQQEKFNVDNGLTPSRVFAQAESGTQQQKCAGQSESGQHPSNSSSVSNWMQQSRGANTEAKPPTQKIKPSTEEEFLSASVKGDGTPEMPGVRGISAAMAINLYRKYYSLDAIHEAAKSNQLMKEHSIGKVRCMKWADPDTIQTIKRGVQILEFHTRRRDDS